MTFEVKFPVAERVVKAPEFGVPLPIVLGAANVDPFKVVAFMVPDPVTPRLDPVPTSIAAVVFVDPVNPENGNAVAEIVPEPVVPRDAPVPTSIAAVVFVPLRIELKVRGFAAMFAKTKASVATFVVLSFVT